MCLGFLYDIMFSLPGTADQHPGLPASAGVWAVCGQAGRGSGLCGLQPHHTDQTEESASG